ANAAITTAKIADASIDNAKIRDGSINNAKIENGAITTAKIGTAQVDTLQIAGEAVTIPRAQNFEDVRVISSGAVIFEFRMNTGGGAVLINAACYVKLSSNGQKRHHYREPYSRHFLVSMKVMARSPAGHEQLIVTRDAVLSEKVERWFGSDNRFETSMESSAQLIAIGIVFLPTQEGNYTYFVKIEVQDNPYTLSVYQASSSLLGIKR
ncbi:hypothetical protein B0189_11125, partial [Moraxella cuniculi]